MKPEEITNKGRDALLALMPEAEVSGTYSSDPECWTWEAFVPVPSEGNPDSGVGVSRQFVSTPDQPQPDEEALNTMAFEMVTTLRGATA